MFIKIKKFLIPIDTIEIIKRIGNGVRVITTTRDLDIIDISDEEYNNIKRKLCCEPEVITFNQPEFTKEFKEEVMSMKLCNRKYCEGCEHIQTIENQIDITEPHIFICKMMNKELLDDMDSLPTPYRFYKSEYHYKEEE